MSKKRSKRTEKALAALAVASTPTVPIPDWGSRMSFSDYLETDRVSSHALMDYDSSPRLYKRKKDGLVPRKQSDAYSFGTAVHVYVLEGSKEFAKQYHVGGGPINEKTGKPYGPTSQKYLDWVKSVGKPIISDSDYAAIVEMHQAIMANEKASAILEEGIPELSIFADLGNMPFKMRLDWYAPSGAILDLKTTRSISDFENDFWQFKYDIQVGSCGLLMKKLTGSVPSYYVLASQKSEPYACKLYWISEETMWSAMNKVKALLFRLATSTVDDHWPYGTEIEGVL